MHTFGKVCVLLLVLLAFVAVRYTSKLYVTRAADVKQKINLEEKMARNAKELDDLRNKVRTTKRELTHEKLSWAPYWNDVDVEVRNDNSVLVNIGAQQGLEAGTTDNAAAKQFLIHCFQSTADGGTEYIGEFRVSDLEDNRALLVPNWDPFEGETDSWNDGQKWRIRALVPSQHVVRFNGLELQTTSYLELLASKLAHLDDQNKLLAIAEERLQRRIDEIDGPQGDVPDADQRPREDVVGLLTTLTELEEERNAILAKSDERRRALLQATEDFERTQAENLQVVNSLKQESNLQDARRRDQNEKATVSR